jgi:hypothetical protein
LLQVEGLVSMEEIKGWLEEAFDLVKLILIASTGQP